MHPKNEKGMVALFCSQLSSRSSGGEFSKNGVRFTKGKEFRDVCIRYTYGFVEVVVVVVEKTSTLRRNPSLIFFFLLCHRFFLLSSARFRPRWSWTMLSTSSSFHITHWSFLRGAAVYAHVISVTPRPRSVNEN